MNWDTPAELLPELVYVPPVFASWNEPATADLLPTPAVPAPLLNTVQEFSRWDEPVPSPNPGGANLDLGYPAFLILGCFPPLRLRICGHLGLLSCDLFALRTVNFCWSTLVRVNNEPFPEPGSGRLVPK